MLLNLNRKLNWQRRNNYLSEKPFGNWTWRWTEGSLPKAFHSQFQVPAGKRPSSNSAAWSSFLYLHCVHRFCDKLYMKRLVCNAIWNYSKVLVAESSEYVWILQKIESVNWNRKHSKPCDGWEKRFNLIGDTLFLEHEIFWFEKSRIEYPRSSLIDGLNEPAPSEINQRNTNERILKQWGK